MRTCLWTAMTIAVVFGTSAVGLAQGVDTPSAALPPPGVYISPYEYHQYSAMGIVLDDPAHDPFENDPVIRERVGADEIETFGSVFSAVEIGQGLGPLTLQGAVTVRTTNRYLGLTGTFQTEILSMGLTGMTPMGPVMIRESPTRASNGRTDITDIGGGMYHIDSFFDVFTELSVDGGMSWVPCDASTHMYLVPEPGTLALLALGGLALMRRRR